MSSDSEYFIGQKIKRIRAETGFSQEKMGKLYGISTSSVADYEDDKRKITAVRDRHLDSLYGGKDDAIKTLAEQDAIAKELVEKRRARGWASRASLAKAAGLRYTIVRHAEEGRWVSPDDLQKMRDALESETATPTPTAITPATMPSKDVWENLPDDELAALMGKLVEVTMRRMLGREAA